MLARKIIVGFGLALVIPALIHNAVDILAGDRPLFIQTEEQWGAGNDGSVARFASRSPSESLDLSGRGPRQTEVDRSVFEALAPPDGLLPGGCELGPPPAGMRPPLNSNPAISSDALWLGIERMQHFGLSEEQQARMAAIREAERGRRPGPGAESREFLSELGAAFDAGYLAAYGRLPEPTARFLAPESIVYVRALHFREMVSKEERDALLAGAPMAGARIVKGDLTILLQGNHGPDVPCFEPLRRYFESMEIAE